MTLNKNFVEIFTKILDNKKKSIKILKYIEKLESKGYIDNNIALFIIKVTIIITSYYPNKKKFICNFFKLLYYSKNESKLDLFKLINKINISYCEDYILDDYHMDKLIFNTFQLIYNSSKINKELSITILNEIILNSFKLKTEDNLLKVKIYLMYVKKSNDFIVKCLDSKNLDGQVYIKIMELCGVTTRLINSFISNK